MQAGDIFREEELRSGGGKRERKKDTRRKMNGRSKKIRNSTTSNGMKAKLC